MYLRFEPAFTNEETQPQLYEAYGLGIWKDVQVPKAQRQPLLKRLPVSTTSAQPSREANKPTQSITAVVDERPASSSNGSATDGKKGHVPMTGSSLLAYRDPNEESSDEDEVDELRTAKPTESAAVDEGDEDDMDPTGAYVAAKLKFTSLERKLGLSNKSGKKGAKAKAKPGMSSVDPSELQEYERLEARLRECERDKTCDLLANMRD